MGASLKERRLPTHMNRDRGIFVELENLVFDLGMEIFSFGGCSLVAPPTAGILYIPFLSISRDPSSLASNQQPIYKDLSSVILFLDYYTYIEDPLTFTITHELLTRTFHPLQRKRASSDHFQSGHRHSKNCHVQIQTQVIKSFTLY